MRCGSAFLIAVALVYAPAHAQKASLAVTGAVEHPLHLQMSDLEKMPHTKVDVKDHDGNPVTYEGVAVADLLKAAGAPAGEKLRGAGMASYVLAHAKDGYRVVFALPELDAGFTDLKVIVAYTMNGKPLAEGQGPLKIVVPQDKRPARWIRMLDRIEVVKIP
jgi:DMSO/TMAO reductase YedYZ molybdopterin-dependent catalytic subunit